MAVDCITERKFKYITNIFMSDVLSVKINKYLFQFGSVRFTFYLRSSHTFENKDGDHDLDVYCWVLFLSFSSRQLFEITRSV